MNRERETVPINTNIKYTNIKYSRFLWIGRERVCVSMSTNICVQRVLQTYERESVCVSMSTNICV